MGEAKRRRAKDPSYGMPQKTRGAEKYGCYADPRMKTFSFFSRKTDESLISGLADMESKGKPRKFEPFYIYDEAKKSRWIDLRNSAPMEAFDALPGDFKAGMFMDCLSDRLKTLIMQSKLGGILLFLTMGYDEERQMPRSVRAAVEEMIAKSMASACLDWTTQEDIEVFYYIRSAVRSGWSRNIDPCLVMRMGDCIDILEDIGSDRVIYIDSHIAITWHQDGAERVGDGELMIAIKDPDGLWSFEAWVGASVPMSSLKNARMAIGNYKASGGKNRKGEIIHAHSGRLSRFLGLTVKGGYAYIFEPDEPPLARGSNFALSYVASYP